MAESDEICQHAFSAPVLSASQTYFATEKFGGPVPTERSLPISEEQLQLKPFSNINSDGVNRLKYRLFCVMLCTYTIAFSDSKQEVWVAISPLLPNIQPRSASIEGDLRHVILKRPINYHPTAYISILHIYHGSCLPVQLCLRPIARLDILRTAPRTNASRHSRHRQLENNPSVGVWLRECPIIHAEPQRPIEPLTTDLRRQIITAVVPLTRICSAAADKLAVLPQPIVS